MNIENTQEAYQAILRELLERYHLISAQDQIAIDESRHHIRNNFYGPLLFIIIDYFKSIEFWFRLVHPDRSMNYLRACQNRVRLLCIRIITENINNNLTHIRYDSVKWTYHGTEYEQQIELPAKPS
jgi:hypothetical protein